MIAPADLLARRFGVLFALLALAASALPFAAHAQTTGGDKKSTAIQLTDSQKAAIARQLKDLREAAKGNILKRNGTAEQIFLAAAGDPKKAVALYEACYKEINYTRLGKEERDYREWRDANEERFEFEPYARGLQMQLQYLWMATRAAQAEDISTIFPDLNTYIAGIGSMQDPPHPLLDSNVGNTVFAQAYDLDDLLDANDDNWELNPMNIGGIYDKTIYPYLRTELPQSLDTAWERRIQAETRLAELFIKFEDGMERYESRNDNEPGRVRGEVSRMAGYIRNKHRAAMLFQKERLPALQWGKAKDQFEYTNQAIGAKAMLDIVAANLGHQNMNAWIAELAQLVQGGETSQPAPPAAPAGT